MTVASMLGAKGREIVATTAETTVADAAATLAAN